jgi:uncharacterized protein YjbI with pentapeptide repeats
MIRLSPFALVLLFGLALLAGCGKKDSGSVEAQPAPGEPPPQAGPAVSERDVPTDLSDYLIRGEMGIPEGATIERRGARKCTVQAGPTFVIEMDRAVQPLSDTKKAWEADVVRWIKDEPNLIVAERKGKDGAFFAFESRTILSDTQIRVASSPGAFTEAQVERMIRSATSLKQTDAIVTAIKREKEARAELAKVNIGVSENADGVEIELRSQVTDEQLDELKHVKGITGVALHDCDKLTAKGMERIAALKTIRHLVFIGDGVDDAFLTPLKSLTDVEDVVISSPSFSDAGLAFVAGYAGLKELLLSAGSGKSRFTGAGFVHLKNCKSFKRLLVSGDLLSEAGFEQLGTLKSIQSLVLDGAGTTDQKLGSLRRLTSLTGLSIRDPISDTGLQHLSGLIEMETLSLTGTRIRGYGLSAASGMTKLKTLSLEGSLIGDAGLEKLKGLSIDKLDLSETPVTDKGLKWLAECPNLQSLKLRGTKITDAAFASLSKLKALNDLDISGTSVTGVGIAQLKELVDLGSLNLQDTSISDAGIAGLDGHPKLMQLNLKDTAVSDAGIAKIAGLPSLTELKLESSDVTKAGVDRFKSNPAKTPTVTWTEPSSEPDPKVVAPPVPLDKLPPADPSALLTKYNAKTKFEDKDIISIDLQGTGITDVELAHLRSLKSLQTLNLSGCSKVTDAGLAYLSGLMSLSEINLAGTAVRGDGLAHLKSVTNLTILELPDSPLTVKQVSPLSGLKGLVRFRAQLPRTDAAIKFLSGLPNLKEVDLRGFDLTNRRLSLIAKISGLERLEIKSRLVGDRGLANLKGLKHLTELRILESSASDEGLQSIGAITSLKSLELNGQRFTDAGLVHLRELTELEKLKIENTGLTDRGMVYLRQFGKLIELELRNADISDKGLPALAELKEIEFIDLSGTKVTDEGLKNFTSLVELRKLNLEGCTITGRGFAALKKLPQLARLHLARCKVSDEGLNGISQVDNLAQLDLTGANITEAGLALLKPLLKFQQLSLDGVKGLTDKSADLLKEFLYLGEVSVRGGALSPKAIAELKKKEGLNVITD